MLPIESKLLLMYHHNTIGGTRPSWLGIHYKVKTVQDDGVESQQSIFVNWFNTVKFETNLTAHEEIENAWKLTQEFVGEPYRFLSLSENATNSVIDMFADILETNGQLHPKLRSPHRSPYDHLRRVRIRERDSSNEDHFLN
ncbi:MAG: hypothetical protein WAV40_01910 [Microgenomates group bacterium]